MEQTQAVSPGEPQAQTPVHPIHQEAQDLAALTKFVEENPDNDPEHPEDTSTPRGPEGEPKEAKAEEPKEEAQVETVEFDEESPVFELDYKTDKGREVKKLSLKELREGYIAKEDYSRRQQRLAEQEAGVETKVKQASLQAQQQYLQQLETHKQLVLKTVAPELQGVDLNKLSMEDPAEAQRLFFRQIQLNQTLQAIEGEQRQAAQKYQEDQRAAFEQAKVQSRKTLESDIPGWGEELYGKVLGSVAKEYGFKNEEVEPVVDARLIKVFHDAYQYRSLQKAKPEVSKRVVAIPKVIKPGSAEKPSPAKESAERSLDRLKKTGKGEDFVNWYLKKQQ